MTAEPMGVDPAHALQRFVEAQREVYARALTEMRRGRKESHWMWFIFPQLAGLGSSTSARHFAIRDLDEARAYLADALLGTRLREIAEAACAVPGSSALDVLGSPDDLKLHSSATLFALVSPRGSVFHRVLERFYRGEPDAATLRLLGFGALDG